jgi:hypothetical protein
MFKRRRGNGNSNGNSSYTEPFACNDCTTVDTSLSLKDASGIQREPPSRYTNELIQPCPRKTLGGQISDQGSILLCMFDKGHAAAIPPSMAASVVQNASKSGVPHLHVRNTLLQWLPTKLAEWIAANLCYELYISAKQGALWTADELNAIITGNLFGCPHGHIHTFGCIPWESDLFNGRI